MSTMIDCIDKSVKLDGVDPDRAAAAKKWFSEQRDHYLRQGMDEAAASARAAVDFKAFSKAAAKDRYHKVMHDLRARREIKAIIDDTLSPAEAVLGLIRYKEGVGYRGKSIQSLVDAHMDEVNARIHKVLEATSLNLMGNSRNAKLLADVVKEKHGQATGNTAAKELAAILEETENSLVRLFNERGGNIQILKNRGMPQSHSADQMEKMGRDAWKASIRNLLAWDKITDFHTGRAFADAPGKVPPDAETDRFLDEVFTGILTRGWDEREPSAAMSASAMYNRHAEHRVLHFKDGDAQMVYNKEFGLADPFTSMVNGLHGLARDIAIMDVLGPNPNSGLEFAKQYALSRSAKSGKSDATKEMKRIERAAARAKAILGEITGAASAPDSIGLSRFMNGTRAYLVGRSLGSAVLSSTTDAAFMSAAAKTVGINRANVLSNTVELMASYASRQEAAQMGYIAETLADTASGYSRFMGKTLGSGPMETLASATLRTSGLQFITDMRKISFQKAWSGHLANLAERPLADLPQGTRAFFTERGFTAQDWDALRDPSGLFKASNGAGFITPHHWAKAQSVMAPDDAQQLGRRFAMAIREHLTVAIPESTAEVRTLMRGGTKAGTLIGEVVRGASLFKGFGVTVLLTQYRRFAASQAWGFNKWQYAAFTVGLPTILLGALAMQLRELAKGNDPRPMDSLEFWGAATLQGGGFGIFGDFFASQQNRFGGGFAQTLAGPQANLIDEFGRLTISNALAAARGDDTYFGRDAAALIGRGTPVLSSHWATRTAWSRMVAEPLMIFLDPQGAKRARDKERKMHREFGTQPYIPFSGAGGQMRMPDFGNALGG